jgi:ankyrin repeat protein
MVVLNRKNNEVIELRNSISELNNKIDITVSDMNTEFSSMKYINELNNHMNTSFISMNTSLCSMKKDILELQIVTRVLDINAVVNHSHGNTILIHYVKHMDYKMVQLLLLRGADINIANKDGFTPLMYSAKYEHTEILKLLLDYGASKNIKNKDGKTAIDIAIFSKNIININLLYLK